MKFIYLYILLIANLFATEYLTPLDNVYKSYFNEDVTPYYRYAKFFQMNKGNIKEVLDKDIDSLKLNEKTLSFLYDYHELNTKKSYSNINNLFEYNSNQLINSFEGIFIQNIYLKENNIIMAKKILSFNFCETLNYKIDKIACMTNNVTIMCINNENYDNELKEVLKLSENASKYSLVYCKTLKNKI